MYCFTRKVNCFTRKHKRFTRKHLINDPFGHKLQIMLINVTMALRVKHLILRVKRFTLRIKLLVLRVKQCIKI